MPLCPPQIPYNLTRDRIQWQAASNSLNYGTAIMATYIYTDYWTSVIRESLKRAAWPLRRTELRHPCEPDLGKT
jgi:hypothetical protein